ncbi:hypothetical protein [Streptomyces sp. NPDC002845]
MPAAAVAAVRMALLGLASGRSADDRTRDPALPGFVAVAHQRIRALGTSQPPRLTHRAALPSQRDVALTATYCVWR